MSFFKYIRYFNDIAIPVICGYGIYNIYLLVKSSNNFALFIGLITASVIAPMWESRK